MLLLGVELKFIDSHSQLPSPAIQLMESTGFVVDIMNLCVIICMTVIGYELQCCTQHTTASSWKKK